MKKQMKKITKSVVSICLMLSTVITPVMAANTQSTSYTVTNSITGAKEISQDAYIPASIYLDLGLQNAQDLCVSEDMMYIADTNNKRIVVVDLSDQEEVKVVGEELLNQPTGVAVDKEGKIYVADSGNSKAFRFAASGELEMVFEKPTTPNFGKNQGYKPVKIAPADGGGVYLISEGSQAGIVHMSGNGEFLGYFASNEVRSSLFDKMVDIFLTEEQKKSFLKRTPPSFGNIFRGADGLIYTMNKGSGVSIKRHSISGLDLLKKAQHLPDIQNPVDMCVSSQGVMYILNSSGKITEITSDGYLLSEFGGSAENLNRTGLFQIPTGIGVDREGSIYVLDAQMQCVQVFAPTQVQSNIHDAIYLYNEGRYEESKAILQEVIKFNNSSFFAHLYMAKNYMQEANYDKAAEHYKIANTKGDYSDAYWEIRNIWLQENMIYILITLIAATLGYYLLKILHKKKNIFGSIVRAKKGLLEKRLFRDFSQLKYGLFHPMDHADNMRLKRTGTMTSATLIYIIIFVWLVLYQVGTGFIFATNVEEYSIISVFLYFVTTIGLFVIGNYFISSINDGNGTLYTIYVSTAFSFAPVVLFTPLVIIFANVATVNEKFFIDTAIYVFIGWSLVNMVASLMEIHRYSFKEIIQNLLITVFFMGVTILATSVGYLLIKQIIGFVVEIIVEVTLRV